MERPENVIRNDINDIDRQVATTDSPHAVQRNQTRLLALIAELLLDVREELGRMRREREREELMALQWPPDGADAQTWAKAFVAAVAVRDA